MNSSKKYSNVTDLMNDIVGSDWCNIKPPKKPNITRRLMQASADIKHSRQRREQGGIYGEVTSDLTKSANKAIKQYRVNMNVPKRESNRLRNITLREIRQIKIEENRKKRREKDGI